MMRDWHPSTGNVHRFYWYKVENSLCRMSMALLVLNMTSCPVSSFEECAGQAGLCPGLWSLDLSHVGKPLP